MEVAALVDEVVLVLVKVVVGLVEVEVDVLVEGVEVDVLVVVDVDVLLEVVEVDVFTVEVVGFDVEDDDLVLLDDSVGKYEFCEKKEAWRESEGGVVERR